MTNCSWIAGCSFRRHFKKVVWHFHLKMITNVEDVAVCLIGCLQDARCFSVDYHRHLKWCFYNNADDVEASTHADYDWFELICTGDRGGNFHTPVVDIVKLKYVSLTKNWRENIPNFSISCSNNSRETYRKRMAWGKVHKLIHINSWIDCCKHLSNRAPIQAYLSTYQSVHSYIHPSSKIRIFPSILCLSSSP